MNLDYIHIKYYMNSKWGFCQQKRQETFILFTDMPTVAWPVSIGKFFSQIFSLIWTTKFCMVLQTIVEQNTKQTALELPKQLNASYTLIIKYLHEFSP